MDLWLKNPRNLRLINDLRLFKTLYICRETFTDVMKTLQNKLFMQNKANFQKVKFDVNRVLTKDYDRMDTWSIRKTKPIQSQLKPIQSQSKPKQTQYKPKQSQFQSQYMLPRLTINSRPNSLGYYTDEIEASAILHNTVSNICRLTGELFGSTMSELTF